MQLMEPKFNKKSSKSNQKYEKIKKKPLKNKSQKKSKIKMIKDTFGCCKDGACPKCGLFHFNCFCCFASCPIHGRPMVYKNLNKKAENYNINNVNIINNYNNEIIFKNINDISFG